MSQFYNQGVSNNVGPGKNQKSPNQKKIGCKKCGKKHEDGCFDIDGAVRRQFIKAFHKFMED